MIQTKTGQVPYLDRWVDRAHFCAFVYNKDGQKLAKSYDEFTALIGSGLWFDAPGKTKTEEKKAFIEENMSNVTSKVSNNNTFDKKTKREATKNQFRAAQSLGK